MTSVFCLSEGFYLTINFHVTLSKKDCLIYLIFALFFKNRHKSFQSFLFFELKEEKDVSLVLYMQ